MPCSDDFGIDGDDTDFITAATQIEASQAGDFDASPRPAKRRRRMLDGSDQLDGPSSPGHGFSEGEDNAHNTTKPLSNVAGTHSRTSFDDEPEEDLEYYHAEELGGLGASQAKLSKHRIHVPEQGAQFAYQIFSQTQRGLDADPSAFRGPVWKRPLAPPASAVGEKSFPSAQGLLRPPNAPGARSVAMKSTANGMARYLIRSPAPSMGVECHDDALIAARLQAEENARSTFGHGFTSGPPAPSQHDASNELADLPSDAFSSSSPEKSPVRELINVTSSQPTGSQAQRPELRGPQQGLKQMTIFGHAATQELSASQAAKKKHAWPLKAKDELPTHHKLDHEEMETWVYPTNLGTIRDYQYNIVARSLYHNTLVALPTGLGKTFIAATVMLNYYRWTKDSQIVFMAPTKPLIAQQMEACYGIVGITKRDTVLMTGETTPALRAEEWQERRVFFMTPQTVINDLKTGICDPKRLVLLVVDEAHKATGSYAYTEVIAFVRRFNPSFRVLALTATPGSTVEAVQAVIDHLGISRVELRTEQSIDIRQYTHQKHTDTELFEYSDEQALIMDHFSKALRPVLEKLRTQNAYWSSDPMQLTAYGLTIARQKWASSEAGRKAPHPVKGMVNTIFVTLSSLAHHIGLLKNHGIGPFYSGVLNFEKNLAEGQVKGKYATQIVQSEDYTKATRMIRGWTNNPDFIGHPKLQYLREVLLNHFLDAGEGRHGSDVPPSATRVMVFTSYRDSTDEICRVLKRNEPMIRPHPFVGQAASKGTEGMDQKKQNAVIQDFKSGKYNTLVATSIGEEGLDIGTVDLIVCFDASSSPIRMLQRIGRTGRKRVGKVVLLLMKGKEENDYAKAQDNYLYIQKTIADASRYEYRDDQSPRILPKGTQPVVDKRIIEIPVENTQPVDLNERGRKSSKGKGKAKRPPKKFHMPDGVQTGFMRASRMGDEEGNIVEEESAPRKKPPAKSKAGLARVKPKTPEPEPVQLPYLQDVLLRPSEQLDLESKYMRVADGDEDMLIRAPDVDRQPLRLGSSKYVGHGRAARAVERALQNIRAVDSEKVARMKELLPGTEALLKDAGEAAFRLVDGVTNTLAEGQGDISEAEAQRGKKTEPTVSAPAKQPRQPVRSVTVVSSAPDAPMDPPSSLDSLPPLPPPTATRRAPPKARNRPRKQAVTKTATPHLSAAYAAEGHSSSPQPTPANMRIGTQGIDLGSDDTSGEDEQEERDSELDDFVVNSDRTIEVASSSQVHSSQGPTVRARGAGKGRLKARALADLREESESEAAEVVSSDTNENDAPAKGQPTLSRKRRVVRSSDSDD